MSYGSSHDNAQFASSGGDRSIFIWDVATGLTTRRLAGHMGKIHAVEFNEDASVLASGAWLPYCRLSGFKLASQARSTRLSGSGTSGPNLDKRFRFLTRHAMPSRVFTLDPQLSLPAQLMAMSVHTTFGRANCARILSVVSAGPRGKRLATHVCRRTGNRSSSHSRQSNSSRNLPRFTSPTYGYDNGQDAE